MWEGFSTKTGIFLSHFDYELPADLIRRLASIIERGIRMPGAGGVNPPAVGGVKTPHSCV